MASALQQLQTGSQVLGSWLQDKGVPIDAATQALEQQLKPVVLRKMVENAIGFTRRSGFKVPELEKGRVLCRMPLKGNTNHIGTMYAGALFTLAEMPGGALYLSSFDTQRFIPIVKEMTLKFVKPAKSDITVEFKLSDEQIQSLQDEADATGKAEFMLDGELKDKNGDVVATSHGVYQLRRK